MASHCERIMKKTGQFQIVYGSLTFVNNPQLTSRETKWQTNVNNLHCRRNDLSNILKLLQVAILDPIYHQRAGKTSLFHMREVDFTHINTCCTFKEYCFLQIDWWIQTLNRVLGQLTCTACPINEARNRQSLQTHWRYLHVFSSLLECFHTKPLLPPTT